MLTGLLTGLSKAVTQWIESAGQWSPAVAVALFLVGSAIMIWRLEAMSDRGMEGTVLGTLIMPYCSGLGNLIFAFVMSNRTLAEKVLAGDPLGLRASREVMTSCLVNNVTNLTLLIGLPAALFGLSLASKAGGKAQKGGAKKAKPAGDSNRLNRLSLLLSLTAAAFFTGAMWALGKDGRINSNDGMVLIGLFLFWQCIHVFEVLKSNAGKSRSPFGAMFLVDVGLLVAGAFIVYVTTAWLVDWISSIRTGFVSAKHLGWLSGWLMVVPNALLAFYYAWKRQPEVVYTSQIGDGHICIPLCIGLYALFQPIIVPHFFELGVWLLLGSAVVHFLMITFLGQLPRVVGVVLVLAYAVFVLRGLQYIS